MGTDVTDDAARAFFANNFRVFAIADRGKRDGLFTGYYEPELRGSRTPSDRFSVPIYRRPDDLVTVDLGAFNDEWRGRRLAGRVEDGRLKPYPTRADITSGALSDQGLELVWVDDPIGAFFLQVQGSGRVRLEEGGDLRIGYAATNGRPYRSIGREMIARGLMKREEVSLQSLRDWLKSHPDQATEILNANPSFVFFRELPEDGPIGAQGVALTPGRSLAVDRAFMPLGVPVWLETTYPDGVEEAGTPLQRLVDRARHRRRDQGDRARRRFLGLGRACREDCRSHEADRPLCGAAAHRVGQEHIGAARLTRLVSSGGFPPTRPALAIGNGCPHAWPKPRACPAPGDRNNDAETLSWRTIPSTSACS